MDGLSGEQKRVLQMMLDVLRGTPGWDRVHPESEKRLLCRVAGRVLTYPWLELDLVYYASRVADEFDDPMPKRHGRSSRKPSCHMRPDVLFEKMLDKEIRLREEEAARAKGIYDNHRDPAPMRSTDRAPEAASSVTDTPYDFGRSLPHPTPGDFDD
jgi:hypothetical protein